MARSLLDANRGVEMSIVGVSGNVCRDGPTCESGLLDDTNFSGSLLPVRSAEFLNVHVLHSAGPSCSG
jgi:hypothetical protein